MESTSAVLNSIVNDYENILSLPKEELLKKASNIRCNLIRIIDQHLSDVEKISSDLRKMKKESSHTHMVISFLHHLISHFPPPVFAPSTSQCVKNIASKDDSDYSEYHGFLFHLLSHLIHLLTYQEVSCVHHDVKNLFIVLMQLIKTKNIFAYRLVILNLLKLLSEMHTIRLKCFDDDNDDDAIQTAHLESFFSPTNPNRLHVATYEHLELLQMACTYLLQVHVSDLSQFAANVVGEAFTVVLHQIDVGLLPLKSQSLRLISEFLKHELLPPGKARRKLLNIAVILMEGTFGKNNNNAYIENGFTQSEVDEYQHGVTDFLSQLFCCEKNNSGLSFATFSFTLQELQHLSILTHVCIKKFLSNSYDECAVLLTACQCIFSSVLRRLLSGEACPSLLLSSCRNLSLGLLQLDMRKASDDAAPQIVASLSYGLAIDVLTSKSQSSAGSDSESVQHASSDVEVKSPLSLSRRKRPHSPKPSLQQPQQQEQRETSLLSAYRNVCGGVAKCSEERSGKTKPLLSDMDAVADLTVQCLILFEAGLHAAMVIKVAGDVLDPAVHLKTDQIFGNSCFPAMHTRLAELLMWASDKMDSDETFKDVFLKLYANLVKVSYLFLAWCHARPEVEQNAASSVEACAVLFSLPWLEDMKWLDLKTGLVFQSSTKMLKVCKALRACDLSAEDAARNLPVIAQCLEGLALLPGGVASSWRRSVLIKWGLSQEHHAVVNVCLSCTPYLCFSLQASSAGNCVFASVADCLASHVGRLENQGLDAEKILSLARLLEPLAVVACSACCLKVAFQCGSSNFSSVTCGSFFQIYLDDSGSRKKGFDRGCLSLFEKVERVIGTALTQLQLASADTVTNIRRALVIGIAKLLRYADHAGSNVVMTKLLENWFSYFEFYDATDSDIALVQRMVDLEDAASKWNDRLADYVESMSCYTAESHDLKPLCHAANLAGNITRYCQSNGVDTVAPVYWRPLLCLFRLLCHCSPRVSSFAFLECEKLTRCGDGGSMLSDHRRRVCETIMECFMNAKRKSRPALDVLEDLSFIYSTSPDQFIESNQQFFLSALLANPQVLSFSVRKNLLKMFSDTLGRPPADVIMHNFKHIFCHAVLRDSNLDELFAVLERATRIKKDSMIRLNYGSLIQHLVGHVSADVDRVCSALKRIQKMKSPEQELLSLSDLLQPHFLSVLTFFNGQLRLASVTLAEKKQICESILCLLKLMDKSHVTPVCVKIVNTLCLAQQVFINSPHSSVCCKAWDTLVRCVDSSSLGSILSQVVVMLLPCFKHYPEQVAHTLEYLIVDNVDHTGEHLCELHFLPEHDALKRVHAFLSNRLKSHVTQQSFHTQLEQATKQVTHESNVVRMHALKRLRTILSNHQASLQRQALLVGAGADPVRHLVSILLACCRDTDSKIRMLAVKCLGEIGAVTPDRLCLATKSKEKERVCVHSSFDDGDFAHDLLITIVQAFLAARPKHQDISAFALQELLKIYECKEGSKDTPGRRLWRRFPEQVLTVLEPHLSSRYMLKLPESSLSSLKKPVLHRKQNMTFHEWIGTFCAALMQMASSVSDDSSKVFQVSRACAAVVRNDINVALFLLPHLVLEVLRCDDEHTDFIVNEVMAVLESTEQEPRNESAPSIASTSSSPLMGGDGKPTNLHGSSLSQQCTQAVFTVLDHVMQWQRQPAPTTGGNAAKTRHAREQSVAATFLARVPQKTLALVSLRCHAHSRALLHLENYLRESCDGKVDSEAASFLQRAFVEMDETDGVAGVVSVRSVEPTPETQLKLLESTGALQDAAACYERIIRNNPNDLSHHKGFVKCLIDLGQSSTAANVIAGMLSANPSWESHLKPYQVEACWRLGEWDLLEKSLELPSMTSDSGWSNGIGRTLLAIKSNEWDKCRKLLDNMYLCQTGPLSAASMESGSYQRGYQHILRLHMLSDLERVVESLSRLDGSSETIDELRLSWQQRLRLVQPSFRAKEPMLSLHRALLPLLSKVAGAPNECERQLGRLWLQSSKIARKSGHLQTAYGALLSAQAFHLPEYCIEHAKWLWQKNESHQALQALQRGFSEHFDVADPNAGPEQRMTRAKVMLLVAKLMEQSSSFDSNTVLRQYKEVVAYMGDWEDSHYHCAKYYDKLMTTLLGENRGTGKSHHLYYIMHHYGRSLLYGTSHIYESLTKLLTVWLDYGANAAKLEKAGRPQSDEDVQRLVDVISDLRLRLPAYVFYVAFSQLTSRICHQHSPTYFELKEMLVKVIQAFPQRTVWLMLAISKSSFKQRASRCQDIFQRVSFQDVVISKFVMDATKLTNKLLELCNKPTGSIHPLSINTHFKSLKRLVEDSSFSKVMLPLQKFMTAALPESKSGEKPESQSSHNPFPDPVVHIVGFEDTVEILPSLQRPKKITIRASDGSKQIFLCKPKDDLRKDARLTEFAAIVNKCLKRDPECGRRQLQIRTYSVVPLNEECGLIEWVSNTHGLRPILLSIYKAKGIYTSGKQLKAWQMNVTEPLHKKLHTFRTKLLPRHPPVFHEWFLTTFPDPSAWYNAKLAYARSVAVMSMVGYILGLGDRHGENILFDANSGEAMHVDFNCLFNKGLTLEVPEIVPFRLTHNMVDAMGPTKYEGFFRRACEVTMNVLREQREPLMSVLKTFIHDPLVEWSKRGRVGGAFDESSGEIVNEKAVSHINDIDKRLRGIVAKNKGLPLSIEGHVHYLIQEATDEEKLCQMYIGWAPFM